MNSPAALASLILLATGGNPAGTERQEGRAFDPPYALVGRIPMEEHSIGNTPATQEAGSNVAADARTPSGVLVRTDELLRLAGLGVILAAAAWWLFRGRKDPLAAAPLRPNRILPEHLIVLIGAFLCMLWVTGRIVQTLADPDRWTLTSGDVVQLLGGVACLVLAGRCFEGGVTRFVFGPASGRARNLLVPRKIWRQAGAAIVLALPALTLCDALYRASSFAIHWVSPGFAFPEHKAIEALRSGSEPAWVLWVGAVVIAPISEEFFFRGLVQTVLRDVSRRPWVAVAVTALVFGVAHWQQPQAVPPIVALGVLLGAAYERTGSLVTPVALHMLFNLKTMVWERLGGG